MDFEAKNEYMIRSVGVRFFALPSNVLKNTFFIVTVFTDRIKQKNGEEYGQILITGSWLPAIPIAFAKVVKDFSLTTMKGNFSRKDTKIHSALKTIAVNMYKL